MNINTIVDALELPRNFAHSLTAGAQIILTLREDGSVDTEVKPAPSPLAPVKSRSATP